MKWNRANRRQFLKGASYSLALPLLPSLMLPRTAWGQTATGPKRIVFVFSGNGQRPEIFWPSEAGVTWNIRDAAGNVKDVLLRNLPGGTDPTKAALSKAFNPSWNSYRDKMMLIRGLDVVGQSGMGHNGFTMLSSTVTELGTGGPGPLNYTIDHLLAGSPKVYPTNPLMRHLYQYLTLDTFSWGTVTTEPSGMRVNPFSNPYDAWSQAFKFVTSGTVDNSVANKMKLQKLALQHNISELETMKVSRRISSDDKSTLNDFISKLINISNTIQPPPVSTAACMKPAAPTSIETPVVANVDAVTNAHVDMLAMAIKCNVTRVSTLVLSPPTDTRPNSAYLAGAKYDHHGSSHHASWNVANDETGNLSSDFLYAYQVLPEVNKYYSDKILRLVKALDVPEPGTNGTFLDNTLIVWGNCDGSVGSDVHLAYSMPVMMVGNLNGYFNMGRLVNYCRPGVEIPYAGQVAGRPYNQFLVTLLDAMGLQPSDYEAITGRAGWGDYAQFGQAATEKTWTQFIDTDAKRRAILPYLKA